MDFTYSGEQTLLRSQIIEFARTELNPGAADRDRQQVFSRDLWASCGRMGLTGLPAPDAVGGSGLDPLSCAVALEALGYGCVDNGLVFSLSAHVVSAVVPLMTFGTAEQQARHLPGLVSGARIGIQAMTEAESGSDPFAMRARAVPDGDGWRLTASKTFISNAPEADLLIVYVLTRPEAGFHGGVTAFLVDATAPGVSVGRKIEKMGLRSAPFGEIVFDDVRVGPEAVLGGVGGGAGVFTHAMDWERTCLFAAHVGQMERLLEISVHHARTRQSGGRPIGKHQAVAHRIADMKVRLQAARLLVYAAASKLGKTREVSLDAAIAKLFVSESLVQVARDTLQVLAAYGYATETGVERELRDALGSTIYSGTSDVQRNIIAAWLGL